MAGSRLDAAGDRIAPNIYTIRGSRSTIALWQDPNLADKLLQDLKEAGARAGLRFAVAPSIEYAEDSGAEEHAITVETAHRDPALGMTEDVAGRTPANIDSGEPPVIPENAFLIVGGVREFALASPVINIGRRLDNDVVIGDPRVSRQHAQLRAINGHYVFFDLESSGGSFINGQRRSQSILYSGDVISLGGVPVVYAQDTALSGSSGGATGPQERHGADRPTVTVHSGIPGQDPMP